MGKRVDLAQLAAQPVLDATLPGLLSAPAPRMLQVPLTAVAANPVNPRETIQDLSDLESMRTTGQLQPCAVVTRAAFLAVYPEHGDRIGTVDYVVVAGSRRRLAAERFGIPTLDVVVRDVLATDRATYYAASVSENIDRRGFDPIEEARAVAHLAQECGTGVRAAEILGKSAGWISQRLALLKLSPTMQGLLRAGDLPIRDARRLAALPEDEQHEAWEREKAAFTAVNTDATRQHASPPDAGDDSSPAQRTRPEVRSVRIPAGATVEQIATILRDHLSQAELDHLIETLAVTPT